MTTRDQAEKMYKRVKTFFLSCVDVNGYPVTKAVVPGKMRDSLGEMYFCTNTSSKFAREIAINEKSSVYFYSRKLVWKGCLLKGKMEIVDDLELKERYWQTKFKYAYPEKSYTDPDFCLIRFTPLSGRFYARFKSRDFTI